MTVRDELRVMEMAGRDQGRGHKYVWTFMHYNLEEKRAAGITMAVAAAKAGHACGEHAWQITHNPAAPTGRAASAARLRETRMVIITRFVKVVCPALF